MWFQRIVAGLLLLTIAGLAAALYFNFRTNNQLQTLKTFVEGYVVCRSGGGLRKIVENTTPFKWNGGTTTRVIWSEPSVKLDKYNMVAKLHPVRRRRLLRLRPDQEEGEHRFEFSRARVIPFEIFPWMENARKSAK